MKKMIGIVIGAVLIACGVICLLNIFGIADINISLDGWWTLFIILPCINGLLTDKDKIGSLIGLFVGVMLLLAAQEVFEYDIIWKAAVPAVIIAIGIKLIIKAFSEKNENACYEKEHTAVFRTQAVDYTEEEITVAKVGAVFGGAKCNLADAKITDGSQLQLLCVFGGADIIVPENVNIKINTFSLFGGISDKRAVNNTNNAAATLTINGFCLFGGADIK